MIFNFNIASLIIFILIINYSQFTIAAACLVDKEVENITFNEISIDVNKKTLPYDIDESGSPISVNCKGKHNQYIYVRSIDGVGSVSGNIYNTNLKGVKFIFSLERNRNRSLRRIHTDKHRRIGNKRVFIGHFSLRIYPGFQSGRINPIKITLARRDENKQDTDEILFTYNIAGIKIKEHSCIVKTPKLNVQMGTVFKKDFRGKGSTTGERTFNIEVNCKDVNQAYITWQGGNSNGVIPADTNSTATGVGIQIFANNTPIYFNKKLNINFSKQLTYSAKFYQTDNSVSAGTVNATATFTIDYK